MIQEVNIPVTVKCRLGVNDRDSWDDIVHFIQTVSEQGGVRKFIIHSRKAILGLDPKANRNIPPLRYDWVLKLKELFPHLELVINGGFTEISQIHDILKPENNLLGCMVGRMAMNNLWEVARVDQEFFPGQDHGEKLTRGEMIEEYSLFAQKM